MRPLAQPAAAPSGTWRAAHAPKRAAVPFAAPSVARRPLPPLRRGRSPLQPVHATDGDGSLPADVSDVLRKYGGDASSGEAPEVQTAWLLLGLTE